MSELIDEDVVNRVYKGGSEAKPEGAHPLMRALYFLCYSTSQELRD
jgi:hypothetical protein